ncbi:MAG: carboxypeptidase regulatory-like domain-containing protein [Thermoplasmata archaeon]|nr:MAG: carboxypeptidase regulatory-like domain-containing protein [Thermoplasmata archaeon]
MDGPYPYPPEEDVDGVTTIPPRGEGWESDQIPQKRLFNIGKLQIAGILLIIVFIWGLVSAIAISMFEIHVLALTEFEDDGKGDIYGYVYDEEGYALTDVTIAIHGSQHFTKTNEEGFFSIENVKEGDYKIEASKEGYQNVTKRVSIESHTPLMVRFTLKEGGFDITEDERYGSNLSDLRHLNYATAVFIVVYGSFALLGGILAYLQRLYWLTMFGALCGIVSGIFSIGIIIAPILSIIALYYIVNNKDEFPTSDASFLERLFGVRRAETRPVGVQRPVPKKLLLHKAHTRPRASGMSKAPAYTDYQPPPPPPPPSLTRSRDEVPPSLDYPPEMDIPPFKCRACGGVVKTEAQGIVCQCGANYHKFCAGSISRCKSCGAPL